MSRLTILTAALTLALITPSPAHGSPPPEEGGWNQFRWGMSQSEVKRALTTQTGPTGELAGGKIVPYPHEPSSGFTVRYSRFSIADEDCDVAFNFRDGKLSRVTITPQYDGDLKRLKEWVLHVSAILTSKYGQPNTTKERAQSQHPAETSLFYLWRTRDATIDLWGSPAWKDDNGKPGAPTIIAQLDYLWTRVELPPDADKL